MQSYLRAQNNTFRLQKKKKKKVILVDLLVACDILPVREVKKVGKYSENAKRFKRSPLKLLHNLIFKSIKDSEFGQCSEEC